MNKSIFAILLLFPGVLQAGAFQEVAGHRYPVEIVSKGLSWSLSGAHHFRFRLFSVFTGALFQAGSNPGARKLTFTYTRSIDAGTLVEQGMRVLRDAHREEEIDARRDLLETVNAAYRDVTRGDRYTFTVIPGRGTWLHFNSEEILFIDDADFGLWYLGIWLGENPMSTPLRNALLEGIHE